MNFCEAALINYNNKLYFFYIAFHLKALYKNSINIMKLSFCLTSEAFEKEPHGLFKIMKFHFGIFLYGVNHQTRFKYQLSLIFLRVLSFNNINKQ